MRALFKVLLSTLVLLAQAGMWQQTPAIQPRVDRLLRHQTSFPLATT
jgi:hypothetical protein